MLTSANRAKLARFKSSAQAYAPVVPASLYRPKVSKTVKTYVKRAIKSNDEQKSFLTSVTIATAYDSTPANLIHDLTKIPNDVDQTDNDGRHGDIAKVDYIDIKGQIDTTTSAGDHYRIIVFQWHKDSNVDYPATSDFFPASGLNGPEVNSAWLQEGEQYFKVLVDKRITISSTNLEPQFHFRIKGKRINHIKFNSQGVTVGKDHIFFMVIGEEALAGSPGTGYARIDCRFRD